MDNRTLYMRIAGMALATTLVTACVSFVVASFKLLPERTLIVPGLLLPNVLPDVKQIVKQIDKRVPQDEFVQASPGYDVPRLVCATLQFQRTVFLIREAGYLSQTRHAAAPFGYAYIGMRIPVKIMHLAPSDEPATPVYLSDYYAVSSGAFLLWFDGLQQLSLHPLAVFLYLLPQALIFSIACGLARVLVEGCSDWSAQVVLPPLLFWGWLVLAAWTTDVSSASDKSAPRPFVPEVLAWGTCALGIGLGRRPWRNIVPKTAVFVLVSIAACLLANVVLAFALAATSRLQVRNDIDIYDVNQVGIVRITHALMMGEEAELPPELESLAAWNEVCPPFRRIVGGALPASSDGPVREGRP